MAHKQSGTMGDIAPTLAPNAGQPLLATLDRHLQAFVTPQPMYPLLVDPVARIDESGVSASPTPT